MGLVVPRNRSLGGYAIPALFLRKTVETAHPDDVLLPAVLLAGHRRLDSSLSLHCRPFLIQLGHQTPRKGITVG